MTRFQQELLSTVFFGELDEVLPAVVHAKQERVADDDEQRLGSRDGHVESGYQIITFNAN